MLTEVDDMSIVSFFQSTPFQMLDRVMEKLDSLSGKLGIRAMFLYIAVLVWMAFLGLAGMQLATAAFAVITASGVLLLPQPKMTFVLPRTFLTA